jgi:transcriptional regulator with XRE-family HTH domain
MATDYGRALGARLRSIRQQQNLSLQGVEEKSRGQWKAVVVGSYERGDRAITVAKLAALASFYGVPVNELLPDGASGSTIEPPPSVVIDLTRLAEMPAPAGQLLQRYIAAIQAQRGDYNGRILSIRQEDLRTLAVMYDRRPSQLAEELIAWGVLNPAASAAVATAPPAQRTARTQPVALPDATV